MCRRTITMAELGEIIYQHHKGISNRKISKSLKVSRNTVKAVLQKVYDAGYCRDSSTIEDITKYVQLIFGSRQDTVSEKQPAISEFAKVHEVIESYLSQPYMTIRQCLHLLKENYPITASETSLHRYVKKHFQEKPEKITIPMPTIPGELVVYRAGFPTGP